MHLKQGKSIQCVNSEITLHLVQRIRQLSLPRVPSVSSCAAVGHFNTDAGSTAPAVLKK